MAQTVILYVWMGCDCVPNGIASIGDIERFLRQVKIEIVKLKRFDLVSRSENMSCIANLGLPVKAAEGEIASLTYHDYYRGPSFDHDKARPGDIWEFVKNVNGMSIYIKLKLDQSRGCVCLSFHELARQVILPYGPAI